MSSKDKERKIPLECTYNEMCEYIQLYRVYHSYDVKMMQKNMSDHDFASHCLDHYKKGIHMHGLEEFLSKKSPLPIMPIDWDESFYHYAKELRNERGHISFAPCCKFYNDLNYVSEGRKELKFAVEFYNSFMEKKTYGIAHMETSKLHRLQSDMLYDSAERGEVYLTLEQIMLMLQGAPTIEFFMRAVFELYEMTACWRGGKRNWKTHKDAVIELEIDDADFSDEIARCMQKTHISRKGVQVDIAEIAALCVFRRKERNIMLLLKRVLNIHEDKEFLLPKLQDMRHFVHNMQGEMDKDSRVLKEEIMKIIQGN